MFLNYKALTIILNSNDALGYFYCSMEGKIVVGFDIEWKVTYKTGDYKKTAVLQLCPSERKCFIFHLSMMRGTILLACSKRTLETLQILHYCIKSVRIRSHSRLYFPALILNTERYEVTELRVLSCVAWVGRGIVGAIFGGGCTPCACHERLKTRSRAFHDVDKMAR